jgi:hypothetical protein
MREMSGNAPATIRYSISRRANVMVMIRPLKAINAVHQAMGQQLAASGQKS